MDCSMPGFPVLHPLPELDQTCPLSRWCYPTISSSVAPFSSCPQSFPESRSFPMSWLFTSGDQSIGASASVFPINIQGWFPLESTGLILQFKGLVFLPLLILADEVKQMLDSGYESQTAHKAPRGHGSLRSARGYLTLTSKDNGIADADWAQDGS